jgi:hypothetical protein
MSEVDEAMRRNDPNEIKRIPGGPVAQRAKEHQNYSRLTPFSRF